MSLHNENCNLIVNYLPQTLTDDEFKSMFSTIGLVKSSKIIRDKITAYSYGFGFVEFVKPEDAQKAICTLSGLQLQNKTIKVAFARPPGEDTKNTNLYIRGLPHCMTQQGLEEEFRSYGGIVQCKVLTNESGQSKGVGFVLFEKKDSAEIALKEMNGKTLMGAAEPLHIKFAEDNAKKVRAPSMPYHHHHPYQPIPRAPYGCGSGYNSGPPGPVRNQGNRFNRFNPMSNSYNGSNGAGSMATPGIVAPPMNAPNSTNTDGHVLYVYNVGTHPDDHMIWSLFGTYGMVLKVNIIRDHTKGICKNYGFVTMANYNDACEAINALNGTYCLGNHPYPLQVSFKTTKAEN